MIVYSATINEFNNDVIMNSISDKILNKLLENNIQIEEYESKLALWEKEYNRLNEKTKKFIY